MLPAIACRIAPSALRPNNKGLECFLNSAGASPPPPGLPAAIGCIPAAAAAAATISSAGCGAAPAGSGSCRGNLHRGMLLVSECAAAAKWRAEICASVLLTLANMSCAN